MERTVSNYSNHSARSAVHIPRLKIRATTQEVNANAADSMVSLPLTPMTVSSSRDLSLGSYSSRYAPSEAPSGFDSRRSSFTSPSFQLSSTSDKPPKKKSFLSSLFSVKEPSSQALASYEKQLKSAGTLRDGPIVASRMPGVSSAKLPAHVHKTNSKWDGNPATANKVVKKDNNGSGDRLQPPSRESFGHRSTPSSSSDSMQHSIRRPSSRATMSAASFHTAHSNCSRNQLAEIYGWEVADFSSIAGSGSSIAGTRAPSLRSNYNSTANIAAQDPLEPPKIPDEYMFTAPEHKGSSPRLPAHSHSPALTPCDELPLTPLGPSPMKEVSSVDSEQTLHEAEDADRSDIRKTVIEAPNQVGEVILTSSGINILSPPISARRRAMTATTTRATLEQQNEASKEPKSILKKESAYAVDDKAHQQSTLDSLFSQTAVLDYYHGPQWKKKMGVHTARRAQRLAAKAEDHTERNASPTPESGLAVHRRKSIVGIFKP